MFGSVLLWLQHGCSMLYRVLRRGWPTRFLIYEAKGFSPRLSMAEWQHGGQNQNPWFTLLVSSVTPASSLET